MSTTQDFQSLCKPKIIEITRGEDRSVPLTVVKQNTCNEPFDLTGATEINVRFPTDTGFLEKKLTLAEVTIVNAVLGMISVTLSDTDTTTLKVGSQQSFDVIIDIGTTRRIALFDELLTVKAALF